MAGKKEEKGKSNNKMTHGIKDTILGMNDNTVLGSDDNNMIKDGNLRIRATNGKKNMTVIKATASPPRARTRKGKEMIRGMIDRRKRPARASRKDMIRAAERDEAMDHITINVIQPIR